MKRKKQPSKKQLLQAMSTEEKKQKKTFVYRPTDAGQESDLARLLEKRPDIQRLGVLGGTFNPIHIGHVQLAQAMIAAADLDLLVLIPTAQPPHKQAPDLAPAQDRLEMCRLAVRGMPDCFVSDMEIRRSGKSYTVETLREIKRFAPGVKIFLITGADMFLTIGDWYKAKEILSLCVPCAAPRDLATAQVLREYASYIGMEESVIVPVAPAPISSTAVRAAVRRGEKPGSMALRGRRSLYFLTSTVQGGGRFDRNAVSGNCGKESQPGTVSSHHVCEKRGGGAGAQIRRRRAKGGDCRHSA